MTAPNWWHRATTEQRLAQLSGGIECGMTARQIAVCSGALVTQVYNFASRHGRPIPINRPRDSKERAIRQFDRHNTRKRYIAGEAVDMWAPVAADIREPRSDVEELRF